MKEKTTIRKWGNSYGIILPKKVLNEQGWGEGQELKIDKDNKKIILSKMDGGFDGAS